MESDLFLKSSFFNNFEEFSLEVMNRKKKKKKRKRKQSLTHSQFRQAKKSVSIKSHIRSN